MDADGYSNGQWGADRLRAGEYPLSSRLVVTETRGVDGNTWTSTIPASLSPGQYVGQASLPYLSNPLTIPPSAYPTRDVSAYRLFDDQHMLTWCISVALHSQTPQFYPMCSSVSVTPFALTHKVTDQQATHGQWFWHKPALRK